MFIDQTKEYSQMLEALRNDKAAFILGRRAGKSQLSKLIQSLANFSVDRLIEINEPVSDETMKTIYEQLKERMHKK